MHGEERCGGADSSNASAGSLRDMSTMLNSRILVTGSAGLIGAALQHALRRAGHEVRELDCTFHESCPEYGDVNSPDMVARAVRDCTGIVHLAAVSRVVWGEQDPGECWRTNVDGTGNVLRAALEAERSPWVVFVSSREVYGQAHCLPVREDAPLHPINIYAHAKVEGERRVFRARERGTQTAIVRLSNAYGSVFDHVDRVVPAFARASAFGLPMTLEGPGNTFDFTHVEDVASGLLSVVARLQRGVMDMPTLHLTTGRPTTLRELAAMANAAGGDRSELIESAHRDFDVSRFVGDPSLAARCLGWRPRVSIEQGVTRMVDAFRTIRPPFDPTSATLCL